MTTKTRKRQESTLLLKIIALALALLIWFRISGRVMESERIQNELYNGILVDYIAPPDTKVIETRTNFITVRVNGPEKDLSQLNASDIKVVLDLSNYSPADYRFTLTEENVQLPQGLPSLAVDKISPENIDVELVDWMRKRLQLVVYTQGNPAEGYQMDELVMTPPTVEVEGRADQLKDLNYLVARDVDIAGLRNSKTGALTFDKTQVPLDATILNLNNLRYRVQISETRNTLAPPEAFVVQVQGEGFVPVNEPQALVQIEGPALVTNWIQVSWLSAFATIPEEGPTLVQPTIESQPDENKPVVNQEEAGSEGGDQAEVPPPPEPIYTLPIQSIWNLPDAIRAEFPDWQERLQRLNLTWIPAQIEVRPAEDDPP